MVNSNMALLALSQLIVDFPTTEVTVYMPVFTVAAAIACGSIFLLLSCFISYLRLTRKVSLGDGGDYLLQRTIRAHANAAEFMPISLLLLWLVESMGVHLIHLYIVTAMLVVGRGLHAWGLVAKRLTLRRQVGALLNYTMLLYTIIILTIEWVYQVAH